MPIRTPNPTAIVVFSLTQYCDTTYDPKSPTAGTTIYRYLGASRLTSLNRLGYSEAAVGKSINKTNINSGEYWTYTYNDANQMTVAADDQTNGTLTQSVTFKYDAFLRRSGNIWAHRNSNNQLVDPRHIAGIGSRLAHAPINTSEFNLQTCSYRGRDRVARHRRCRPTP